MTSLIEARNISKAYDGRAVVEHVNLAILPKQIITLIGPNGCGKTTLLRLLLGLETPDAGAIIRKPGLRVGYMPQKFHVEATLPITVEWFLQLYAGKQKAAVASLVAELGIAHLLGSPVQLLSGGEYQRVMLARALLCAPELLVLDEPVQGVDINGQAALYALITRISRERGIAVLMVSHDLHLVMSSTDEVICLNHHVCCAGHPTAVQNDPAFRDLFGAHVAASLAVYHHHHDHTHA